MVISLVIKESARLSDLCFPGPRVLILLDIPLSASMFEIVIAIPG